MGARFYLLATRVSLLAAWLSAAILVGIALFIALEIVLRNLFNTSTYVTGEFVGYGIAAMTFLAMGHALASGDLIRVRLVTDLLGPRARRGVELVCVVLTLLAMILLAWFFLKSTERFWSNGSVSETIAETPLWIPQAVMLAGILVFALQLVAHGAMLIADPDHRLPEAEEAPPHE